MQKRVLLVITKSNWGGAQRYVYNLARSLPKSSFSVAVASGGNGFLFHRLVECGIRTIAISNLRRDVNVTEDVATFFALWRIIRSEQPHILHLNSSKIGAMGALIGRILGVPRIVFTAHGWAFAEERGRTEKFVLKIIYWLTIILAHKTIAVSYAVRQEMSSLPFVTQKITVIHNGLEPFETLSRTVARSKLAGRNPLLKDRLDDPRTLVTGTNAELHPIKGLSFAIKGIQLLVERGYKNIIFIVSGDGDERKNLEQLIKELKLEKTVFLLGFVAEAPEYLKAFDIFLMSSLHEGLGFAILEAGWLARPVVASAVGGISEILDQGVTGVLIPARDSTAIANALEELIKDGRKRESLGRALKEKVNKVFRWEQTVEKTLSVYYQPLHS